MEGRSSGASWYGFESNVAEIDSPSGVVNGVLFLHWYSWFKCPLFPWLLSHTPLNTHSFTRIHAFAQHCGVHNIAGDWSWGRVRTQDQIHDSVCLFWVTTVTLHTGSLMDIFCWKLLCTHNYPTAQAHTQMLEVNGFCGCFSSCAVIKEGQSLLKVARWELRRHRISASLGSQLNCVDR